MVERILKEDHINYSMPYPNYEVKANGEFHKILRSEKLQRLLVTVMHKAEIPIPVLLIADQMVQGGAQFQGLMLHAPRGGGVCFRYQDGSNKSRIQFVVRTPSAVVRNDHEFHAKVNNAFTSLLSAKQQQSRNEAAQPQSKQNGGTHMTTTSSVTNASQPASAEAGNEAKTSTLVARIAAFRKEHGLTIARFADLCGFSPSTLYKVGQGGFVADATIARIEAVLSGRKPLAAPSGEAFDTFGRSLRRYV